MTCSEFSMAKVTVKPNPMSCCALCRTWFYRTETHNHLHSLKHHLELEALTTRVNAHQCQACETSHMGFKDYKCHISSPKHNLKMKKLKFKRRMFFESTLDYETLSRLRMRNREQRKARKKKRKELKKMTKKAAAAEAAAAAGRQRSMMGPGQSGTQVKTQPPLGRNQPRAAASQPKDPNKENRLAGRLGWQLPGYANTPQPCGVGQADSLERHNYNKKTQASQLTRSKPKCQIKSMISGSCNIKHQNRLTRDDDGKKLLAGKLKNRGKKRKGAKPFNHTSNKLTTSISIDLCTYRSFSNGTDQDYTSDDLPECGSIIFDTRPVPNIPERSRDSRQSGFNSPVFVCSSREPNPGPSQDKDTDPIQSKGMTDIINQIRRALSDPCGVAQTRIEQKTDMSMAAADTMSDPRRQVSRAGASQDRVARLSTQALPPSLSKHMSEAMPQPSLNTASRIQNARESRQVQGQEVGLKPSMRRLPSSSSSQRKIKKEMYQEDTKSGQEEVRVTSSFDTELVHHLSNPEDWTVEEALPLPPAPAQVAPDREGPKGAQRLEQPRTSSGFPVSLKAESSWCHDNDGVGISRAEKRKRKRRNTQGSDIPGVSDDHSVKRQRGKSEKADSGQVDQLLAVSLKEDELSRSLLAVDASLLQARSALEAAYSEVQRLLVVKQQVMAEVTGLRARRIEILQGMKVGCSVVPRQENITTILGTQYSPLPPPAPVSTPNVFSSTLPPLAFSPVHPLPTSSPHTLGPLHPSLPPTVTTEPANVPQYSRPSHLLKQECVYPPSQGTVAVSPNLQRVSESPSASITTLVPASVAQQTPLTTPSTPASPLARLPAVSPSNNQREVDVTAPTLSKSVGVQSDKVKLEINKDLKELSSSASDSEEELEGPIKASVAPESLEDSDCSIQMVETTASPCREEVVSIEDSDSEDDPGSPTPPQASSAPSQASSAPSQASSARPQASSALSQASSAPSQASSARPQASSARPQASSALSQASSAPSQASSAPSQASSARPQASSAPPQASSAPPKASSPSSGPLKPSTVDVASSSPQTTAPTALLKNIKQDVHQREPSDEEPSLGAFEGHTGPVHGLQIHAGLLYTCSADSTARAFSLLSRKCQAVFKGHTNKINCLLVSSLPGLPSRLYTGSSDNTVRCYSIKSTKCLKQISLPDRVLCLHTAWNILYVGLASGSVVTFDLKTQRQLDVFECHGPRGVSCLGTAQEGSRRVLLVGSYDSSISVRDARSGLLLRSLQGHTKTVLCMKVVNDLVFSGSSDTSVHAHNIHNGELLRIYKGHGHAVTALAILGNVMVTASLDKLVRVYELQSHDRLQVYGGHSDMVMCMAIHKSVIYTGCYDGTVQAVRFNLMENYRCWWHGCSLIFAMPDHLVQHLLCDHSNAQLQNIKCRWKSCDAFFSAKQSTLKEMPGHMRKHVKQDSRLES